MQLYPGANPVTVWSSYAFAVNYGVWPTPDCAVGGDQRDAATLMAAVQSVTDRSNLLGNRVALLNCIDGSAGSSSFTAAIHNWNTWIYNGPSWTYNTGDFVLNTSSYVVGTHTFHVGDPAAPGGLGIGHLTVENGSDITIKSGAALVVTGTGQITVTAGAGLVVTDTGKARFDAVPHISDDPGADGALSSANITKMVVVFETDGAGGFSASDAGYNVQSVALQGTQFARITFKRPMANGNHYFVGGSISGVSSGTPTGYMIGAYNQTLAHVDIAAFINNTNRVDLSTTTDIIVFRIEIVDPSTTP